jgi:hypothetical protein
MIAAGHIRVPSIAMLVNVANIPPAGVKAPYINDWNMAAREPTPKKILSDMTMTESEGVPYPQQYHWARNRGS